MKKSLIHAWLVLCVALAGGPLATATSMVPMSVETLTEKAALVTEGEATRSWSQWNAQHTLIYTYTEFHVMQTLKGSAPTRLVVKQLGGTVGNTTQHVSGVRYWAPGEASVLFLRPSEAADGTHVVVGLVQGDFRMQPLDSGEVRVSNGAPEVQWLSTTHAEVQPQGSMTLRELETRVQRMRGTSQ